MHMCIYIYIYIHIYIIIFISKNIVYIQLQAIYNYRKCIMYPMCKQTRAMKCTVQMQSQSRIVNCTTLVFYTWAQQL